MKIVIYAIAKDEAKHVRRFWIVFIIVSRHRESSNL